MRISDGFPFGFSFGFSLGFCSSLGSCSRLFSLRALLPGLKPMRLARLGLLLVLPLTATVCFADETDPATVTMAKTIIADYHARRAECASAPDNEKSMCYYRLKIGQWDYKEAKRILAEYNSEPVRIAGSQP